PASRPLTPPNLHSGGHSQTPSRGNGHGGTTEGGVAVETATERFSITDEVEAELQSELSPAREKLLRPELLHEVFLNPGIYLLIAGIVIGFVSQKQGVSVTRDDDTLFISLFPGLLCLFLLEMGMTASSKLRDLKQAGWRFIAYGL